MPAKSKVHYSGTYQHRARALRAQAYADPSTRCWRCGLTLAEHGRKWTAGHTIDRVGELAAECERCNASAGATAGNKARAGESAFVASRKW